MVGRPVSITSSGIVVAGASSKHSYEDKARIIEAALKTHVLDAADENVIRRFPPYVQMYEFEGLLFSDPVKLAAGLHVEV